MISQCVILVGGMGTRLGELTRGTPKPLLPVAGKPFLDHLIRNAARFGFTDIILLAGYLGDQILSRYSGAQRIAGRKVNVRVIVEREPAGTGGALTYLCDVVHDKFVLMNGDSWLSFDLRAFAEKPGAVPNLAKIALRPHHDRGRYGAVAMKDGRIQQFDAAGLDENARYINAGIYVASRELIGRASVPCSLERDIFAKLAAEGLLAGEAADGFFIDIGVPADYARADRDIAENLFRPAVFFDRDGVLNVDDGYTHKPTDLKWRDGAIDAIKAVNDAGFYAFVVTNQAGVAYGHYSEADVDLFHQEMDKQLAAKGAHIDEFSYCPFHPEGSIERYRKSSANRKPEPGMIMGLLSEWQVDQHSSFLIGDKQSDMDAARAAGMPGLLYEGGDLYSFMKEHLPGSRLEP